jgi:hypothetical protein
MYRSARVTAIASSRSGNRNTHSIYLLITAVSRDWMIKTPTRVPFTVMKGLKCPKLRVAWPLQVLLPVQ